MFDDLQKNTAAAPVEDMFGGVDKVKEKLPLRPTALPSTPQAPFQPSVSSSPSADLGADTEMYARDNKKYFILGVIILAVAGLIFGGFWAFNKFGKAQIKKIENNNNDIQPQDATLPVVNEPVAEKKEEPMPPQIPAVPAAPVAVDSDQDGLTDEEETKTYKTDPDVTDTDSDGLFDREEVKVYKTNPLKKDTDGDGYSDGAEVKAGFNPNGPGKLYEIK